MKNAEIKKKTDGRNFFEVKTVTCPIGRSFKSIQMLKCFIPFTEICQALKCLIFKFIWECCAEGVYLRINIFVQLPGRILE